MINKSFFSGFTLDDYLELTTQDLSFPLESTQIKMSIKKKYFLDWFFSFPLWCGKRIYKLKNSKSENTRWYHSNLWQCDIRRTGNQIEKNWRRFVRARGSAGKARTHNRDVQVSGEETLTGPSSEMKKKKKLLRWRISFFSLPVTLSAKAECKLIK